MADYTLTDVDQSKLDRWISEINSKRPRAGATARSYIDFHFSRASGIGLSVTATDRITGQTLDLTDHENW